jgi:hypothetical protein
MTCKLWPVKRQHFRDRVWGPFFSEDVAAACSLQAGTTANEYMRELPESVVQMTRTRKEKNT